jgi:hypothetical protein
MVELPPAVTVIVRCHALISSFSIEILWSPTVNRMVDGVALMKLSTDYPDFISKLDVVAQRYGQNMLLAFPDPQDNGKGL